MVAETQSSTTNRRKFIRIPSSCRLSTQKILFSTKADAASSGQAQNIGAGGVLFVADRDYHRNELVKMMIALPSWKGDHGHLFPADDNGGTSAIMAICQIIRCKQVSPGNYEVAAKFVDVYEDDLMSLKSFIEHEVERIGASPE